MFEPEIIPEGRRAPVVFRRGPQVLGGQSTKYPVFWLCMNPDCREHERGAFVFRSDYPECPKCGCGAPTVQKRALVHLLLRNNKGPIVGDLGLRWELACDTKRDYLATIDNGEACTGDSRHVNCQACLKRVGTKVVVKGHAINFGAVDDEAVEKIKAMNV